MQDADKGISGASQGNLVGEGLRIAVVRARFNDTVTTAMEQACVDELLALKVDCRALDHRIAIANAILTVDTQAQALARATEKGIDAARVAIAMVNVLEDLS